MDSPSAPGRRDPLVKALFGLSDAMLSLVLFAAGAGAIAAMPVAGLLPSRMGGTGMTLRISGPIFAVLLAALPLMRVLSAEIAPLAICAFLFGMFNVLVDVPMNAHASVVESRWGRAIMSSFHAAWSGGGLVGAAFGGLLISHGASAAVQLGVEALATLAIALTASFQIGAGDAHPAGTFFALPERRLVSLGAIAFLSVFAEASVNDWSALYLSAGVGMIDRRRRQENDRRRRGRRKVEVRIVEHQDGPFDIDDFLRRRRRHVIGDDGEAWRRIERRGQARKPAPRVGGMRAAWIALKVRPVGLRRVDVAAPPPGDRFAARGDDRADPRAASTRL